MNNDLKQIFRVYFEEKIDYTVKKIFLQVDFTDYEKAHDYVTFLNHLEHNLSSGKNFMIESFYE